MKNEEVIRQARHAFAEVGECKKMMELLLDH
jgi:hypothetical protein